MGFMEMRSEDRMNRFVKTRGSNFGNDNANTNPVTLKSGGSSKLKRSSDFPSRIKSNELVTCQVGIISGDKKDKVLHIMRDIRLPIKIPKNATC